MTEEEIRPIAEDYVEEYCHCPDGEYTDGSLVCAGIGTALIVSRQLEKKIADLEEENAELKVRNAELKGMYAHSAREAGTYKQFLEAKEKENAELKEQCSILADCNTCISACKTENIEMKNNLTKAKEIIKDFLLMAEVEHLKDRYETVDEAEQFLKETK